MRHPPIATCRRARTLPLVAACFAAAATAQDNRPPTELPPVEVQATPLGEGARPAEPRPSTRLRGEGLRERQGQTLGETIGEELGVANSSFGPGVGLPVIRGLTGSRVRILSNGGATHDASWVSPDHATTADPILADEVRILRGPATIRYGGGAIGGAVEVLDGRIPERPPARPFGGRAEGRYGTNGTEGVAALRLDGGNARFGLHGSGFARSRGDISIPGCAIDDAAIRRQFGLINLRNTCGSVPNSDARSAGGSLGASAFSDFGFVGGSFTGLASNYGIPPSAGGHGGGADVVRIDLDNKRYDGRLEYWVDGRWIETVRLNAARVEYRHDEVENGVIGTTFRNDATDGRLEVDHRLGERVSGVLGGQILHRDFSALGAEAFVPQTDLKTDALYLIERVALGPVTLEGGWRREWNDVVAGPQRTVDRRVLNFPKRSFDLESYSAAAYWRFLPAARVGAIVARASRAPEVQELYSFGPHLATRTFDQGNSNLKPEAIRSLDLRLEVDAERLRIDATAFWSEGSNFIYQRTVPNIFYDTEEQRFRARCVRLEDCLPIVRYTQADARFNGYEAELGVRFDLPALGRMELAVFSDYVRGRLLTQPNEDVPRLPPRRYGVQLAKLGGAWTARIRFTRADAQDRPGPNETPTAGYNLLNAYASYALPPAHGVAPVLFVTARNVLNDEIRNSTSFLRSYSPEPGRSVIFGVNASF